MTGKPANYSFGPFVLRGLKLQVTRNGTPVPLTATEFKLVYALVETAFDDRPEITHDELLRRVWPSSQTGKPKNRKIKALGVNEPLDPFENLRQHVSKLRKKLSSQPDSSEYDPNEFIKNTYGGFALTVPVTESTAETVTFIKASPLGVSHSGAGADPAHPPYVGPQPFPPERADLFFGRENECDELMRLLTGGERRVIVLHSASGAGKTSLLNTMLARRLREQDVLLLPVARVGIPLEGVSEGKPQPSENLYTLAAITSMGDDAVRDRSIDSNWSAFLRSKLPARSSGLVLVLDQLEEIVTARPLGPPNHKREFFLQLSVALRDCPSLRVVLAFRQEYLSELYRVATDLSPYWVSFRLDGLTVKGAYEAIVNPAREDGVGFDPDVVAALVNELARHRYTDAVGNDYDEPGEFVEPLQLQVVCDALWRRLPYHVERVSWPEIYQAVREDSLGAGTAHTRDAAIRTFVTSILRDFCGQAIEEVAREGQTFPVELIDLGCQQFLTKNGIRLPVHRDAEYTGDLPNRIVEALARRQLLRVEERRGEYWFELAHDTLIEPIRMRGEQIDSQCLQKLWSVVISEIAASETVRAEGVSEEVLIEDCFSDFVDDMGSALRVSGHSFGRGNLQPFTVGMLVASGLVRSTPDELALSHPKLASALYQIRITSKQRDLQPLSAAARIVFATVMATMIAVAVTMLTRAFLAGFHLTLTQAPDVGVFAGWFQGVIGAVVWGVFIAATLSRRWFVLERSRPQRKHPGWSWGLTGAAAGLFGGMLITVALLKAQRPESLSAAGWIPMRDSSVVTALTETGFGWTMFLLGAGVGWGCGFTTIRILLSRKWSTFNRIPKPTSLRRTGQVLARCLGLVFRRVYLVFIPMAMAGGLLYLLVSVLSSPPHFLRIFGECLSIAFGAIGLVAGLLFGLYLLGKGVDIPADDTT